MLRTKRRISRLVATLFGVWPIHPHEYTIPHHRIGIWLARFLRRMF
nr:hypothetical protein [Oscillochloris trichoides]